MIRVDANEAWRTKEEALKNIEWLAGDPHVQFVEQPLPAATPATDWHWLKKRSPLPIFADESHHFADDIDHAARMLSRSEREAGEKRRHQRRATKRQSARASRIENDARLHYCLRRACLIERAAAHLAELCDYLDLDGNLLITNDPYAGVRRRMVFSRLPELRKKQFAVSAR